MGIRKAAVLKLTLQAQELEAGVHRGQLTRADDGQWMLNGVALGSWLQQFEGREIVLIAAPLDDDRAMEVHSCNRCGRDYVESECPHCAETRHRLRPRW